MFVGTLNEGRVCVITVPFRQTLMSTEWDVSTLNAFTEHPESVLLY